MYRIIYKTDTGKIETCRRMKDNILQLQLRQAPNLGYINGYVSNYAKYKINLETLQVEENTNYSEEISLNKWMRDRRNNLLIACDWTQGEDSPLSAEKKAEWQTYRQALRDVPANNSSAVNREDVVWPTPPGA
jgi:hypothetical protein